MLITAPQCSQIGFVVSGISSSPLEFSEDFPVAFNNRVDEPSRRLSNSVLVALYSCRLAVEATERLRNNSLLRLSAIFSPSVFGLSVQLATGISFD
jgi:hypothetical protein